MSNSKSNGFAAPSRTHGSDRFYCPPAARKNQNQQQQLQLQRPFNSDNTRLDFAEPDTRTDSDDSALLRPNSVASSSPPTTPKLTNFDRILDSLTPSVPAQLSFQPGMKGHRTPPSNADHWFYLEDLWESFAESSAFGVEVPLVVNGSDSIQQYYVPYLSAIQLYAEKRRVEENLEEASSDGGNEVEANKRARGDNLTNIYSQRLSRLTLREGTTTSRSSSYETEVSTLASEFPYLKKYRSSDLSPSSWFSVAWYPIYRIPVTTLKSLDATFLTFHSLSTNSISRNQPQYCASSSSGSKKVQCVGGSSNISLPIFALASYKYRGSVLSPDGASELEQANSLLQAASDWLHRLQVKHPDYEYFASRSSQWR
ncbi:hypothetical protein RIF29_22378 [Crotalaria pallida]|uniref:Uncharacterized protein n=1 Tax=Crotalaria pallida TaxID=3830 RepID=A0AAN9F6H6_CROPI